MFVQAFRLARRPLQIEPHGKISESVFQERIRVLAPEVYAENSAHGSTSLPTKRSRNSNRLLLIPYRALLRSQRLYAKPGRPTRTT